MPDLEDAIGDAVADAVETAEPEAAEPEAAESAEHAIQQITEVSGQERAQAWHETTNAHLETIKEQNRLQLDQQGETNRLLRELLLNQRSPSEEASSIASETPSAQVEEMADELTETAEAIPVEIAPAEAENREPKRRQPLFRRKLGRRA